MDPLHALERLVEQYGYLALLVGTFLEGETILLVAAFAAHQGYLRLDYVVAVAFLGSFAADQTWYLLGRRYGRRYVAARPKLAARVAGLSRLIERRPNLFILGFRFVYGIRNIAPVAIALSDVAPLRFLALNALAALVWSAAGGVLGYLFGAAVEAFAGDLATVEHRVLAAVALALLGWFGARRLCPRLRRRGGRA